MTNDTLLHTHEYRIEQFAVRVPLTNDYGGFNRRGQRWMAGDEWLRDPDLVLRVLTRYLRKQIRRQAGVAASTGTLFAPRPETPWVGASVRAVRNVGQLDVDLIQKWVDAPRHHVYTVVCQSEHRQ